MDYALSLKTGIHISAAEVSKSAAYRASLKFLLICPECGEPVHFRKLEPPYNTPFFAHYKQQEAAKALHDCSLRAVGTSFKPASQVIPGLAHGQTVDRFQHDFYKSFHSSFGNYSDELFSYLNNVEHQQISDKKYIAYIKAVEKEFSNSCVKRIEFSRNDILLTESVADVCLFLKSSYGRWIGGVLHHIANFVAASHQPSMQESAIGRIPILHNRKSFVFALDHSKLTTIQSHIKRIQPSDSLLAQISAALIGYVLLKWRFPGAEIDLVTTAKLQVSTASNFSKQHILNSQIRSQTPIDPSILRHISKRNSEAVSTAIQVGTKNTQSAIARRQAKISASYEKLTTENTINPTKNSHPAFVTSIDGLNSPLQISADTERRILLLMNEAKSLPAPQETLETKEDVLEWSGKRNAIEAYFLAGFNGVAHTPAKFSDPTLSARLKGWLQLAKQIK
jgi:hypothetical protein